MRSKTSLPLGANLGRLIKSLFIIMEACRKLLSAKRKIQ